MGAGSWGTVFAQVVCDAGNEVCVWARRDDVAQEITTRHTNTGYLPDTPLSPLMTADSDAAAVLSGAQVVVLAVPAQSLRKNLAEWGAYIAKSAVVVSLMKGIEIGTGKRMTEVISESLGLPAEQIAAVSGPNLAREIAERQPTATVVASTREETAETVSALSANSYFRPYTNTDVIGVELGGAVKNVIALAVGMADGQGLGDNSKASIITRGLAETTRLTLAMGGRTHTLSGLAGMGDLVATCASPLSRNRTFGRLIGSGLTLEEATAETKQTAEGVKSAKAVVALGRAYGVELPIAMAVLAVLAGKMTVADMAVQLLSRKRKSEDPHV